jgi:hypothetical protein
MPVLMTTSTSPELALRLARALAGDEFAAAHRSFILASFDRQDGNLREVFFELYDQYERANYPYPKLPASVRS